MKNSSSVSIGHKAIGWTFSTPIQTTLYISLVTLTLWTVFFTDYPPIHNQLHSLRHHTLLVNCH